MGGGIALILLNCMEKTPLSWVLGKFITMLIIFVLQSETISVKLDNHCNMVHQA